LALLHEIGMAETHAAADIPVDRFIATYRAKYPKAVEWSLSGLLESDAASSHGLVLGQVRTLPSLERLHPDGGRDLLPRLLVQVMPHIFTHEPSLLHPVQVVEIW